MTQIRPFRFDAGPHEYIDRTTGEVIPHITGLLKQAGWVDDLWMTEESSVRGTAVHALTAEYDLGAIEDLRRVCSPYKAWLQAHVATMAIVRPEFLSVELPRAHPTLNYAGRLDRTWKAWQLPGLLEIKSGEKQKGHQIQTALQAILVADEFHLPAEQLGRWALYLQENGRGKLIEHKDRRDFQEARRIIKERCT